MVRRKPQDVRRCSYYCLLPQTSPPTPKEWEAVASSSFHEDGSCSRLEDKTTTCTGWVELEQHYHGGLMTIIMQKDTPL